MRKFLAAAASFLFLASAAASQEIQLLEETVAAQAIGALMSPIAPLVSGDAGSTTNITQIGDGNFASAAVEGRSNLTVIDQSGSRNRAVQAIQGANSALLLVQGGTNNNVLQASNGDNNFQLVGVGGNNNNVGFIQSGDNLAGVLDVHNAHNSNVIAIQTPQSGRYLMPTGLSHIRNTTVVIVPGRMYVIPHKQ